MTRVKPVVRLTGRDGNAFAISWRNGTGFEEVRVLKRRTGGVCRGSEGGRLRQPATGLYAVGGRCLKLGPELC